MLLVAILFFISDLFPSDFDIDHYVYLTCIDDPSSAVTVNWISNTRDVDSYVSYKVHGTSQWLSEQGTIVEMPDFNLLIHRVKIGNLIPNTQYDFFLDGGSEIHNFVTLPCDLNNQSIKIAIGGDIFSNYMWFESMCNVVSQQNPNLVILGGDIVYDKNRTLDSLVNNWLMFIFSWNKLMRGAIGNLLPFAPVIGNHDFEYGVRSPFNLFMGINENNLTYKVLDISAFASFFLLDTHHQHPIDGTQTNWLREELSKRNNIPYKFAVYHQAAFPSKYKYESLKPTLIRRYWSPIFEEFGILCAFEHHNHSYKRTYPIRREKIDPNGVIYVGDGCWGVKPRRTRNSWYLEKSANNFCVNFLKISKNQCDFFSLCIDNTIIDGCVLNTNNKSGNEVLEASKK